jgi:hypothetical protein
MRRDTCLSKVSPVTDDQRVEVDALIAEARAAGRWLSEYEVAARLGLGLYAASAC